MQIFVAPGFNCVKMNAIGIKLCHLNPPPEQERRENEEQKGVLRFNISECMD
jgi:hypothetical protein